MNFFLTVFCLLCHGLGKCFCFFRHSGIRYACFRMQRAFYTGMLSGCFRKFGRGSQLAPGLLLIHPERISIGEESSIQKNCVLEVCSPDGVLELGDKVSLGEYSHITAADHVKIGSGVLTGRFVLITDNAHGHCSREEMAMTPLSRPVVSKGEVVIGNNVWLGDKVTVLPGVHIGDGAVIGANSVVTRDIPSGTVAAGIPCKVMKDLNK